MAEPVKVLAFAGSLREKSFNRALVAAAAEMAPDHISIQVFDLAPIPLFNADVEAKGTPEVVEHFKHAIAAADALLIATPEYNYSVTGVLKNALDWASRRLSATEPSALNGKPAAIMGAGGRFGTLRAQNHLRDILLHNDIKVLNRPQVMVARAWEHFDDEGRLADEETRANVLELTVELAKWTTLLR